MLLWTGSAQAREASAEMMVGVTVVGALEAQETTSKSGEQVLVVNSTSEAAISADEGVEVVEEDGSWTAAATVESSEPLYVTVTY